MQAHALDPKLVELGHAAVDGEGEAALEHGSDRQLPLR
jgi:hypothetical protein